MSVMLWVNFIACTIMLVGCVWALRMGLATNIVGVVLVTAGSLINLARILRLEYQPEPGGMLINLGLAYLCFVLIWKRYTEPVQ